jgi:hypothetical protein
MPHPEYTPEERYRLYVLVPVPPTVINPPAGYTLTLKGTCATAEAVGTAMQCWADDARDGNDEWLPVYVLDGLHRQWLTCPPVGAHR